MPDGASPTRSRAQSFGGSGSLDAVFNPASGTYLMPDLAHSIRDASRTPPDESAQLVAIVDTGILSAHPLIQPRLVGSADFTGTSAEDEAGHGTQVAITLAVTDPNVRLLSAKVLAQDDAPLSVQIQRIASGVTWATERHARIINVCVGFLTPCGTAHQPLCGAITMALDGGCVVLVAGEAVCPAQCDPRLITVGEITPSGQRHSNVHPDVWETTWGPTAVIPWEQWLSH